MSFLSQLFFSDKEKISAIFDIGGGSVEGALVAFPKTGIPHIIYSSKSSVKTGKRATAEVIFREVGNSVKEVADSLFKNGIKKPKFLKRGSAKIDSVHFFISSVFCASQTKIINVEKENPFYVTDSLINGIIENEEKLFSDTNHDEKQSAFRSDISLLEKKIIQINLNGYSVSDPYKKKIKNVSFYLFMSFLPNVLKKVLNEAGLRHFHAHSVYFHSFALTSYTALRNILKDQPSFLLLDIGRNVTEINLVKNGILFETLSFPSGTEDLLDAVSSNLKTTSDPMSVLRGFRDGHFEEKYSAKVKKTVENAKTKWIEHFRVALSTFSNEFSLPHRLFIISDDDFVSIFANFLKDEKFKRFEVLDELFSITQVDSKFLSGFHRFDDKGSKDPFIALEGIFLSSNIH